MFDPSLDNFHSVCMIVCATTVQAEAIRVALGDMEGVHYLIEDEWEARKATLPAVQATEDATLRALFASLVPALPKPAPSWPQEARDAYVSYVRCSGNINPVQMQLQQRADSNIMAADELAAMATDGQHRRLLLEFLLLCIQLMPYSATELDLLPKLHQRGVPTTDAIASYLKLRGRWVARGNMPEQPKPDQVRLLEVTAGVPSEKRISPGHAAVLDELAKVITRQLEMVQAKDQRRPVLPQILSQISLRDDSDKSYARPTSMPGGLADNMVNIACSYADDCEEVRQQRYQRATSSVNMRTTPQHPSNFMTMKVKEGACRPVSVYVMPDGSEGHSTSVSPEFCRLVLRFALEEDNLKVATVSSVHIPSSKVPEGMLIRGSVELSLLGLLTGEHMANIVPAQSKVTSIYKLGDIGSILRSWHHEAWFEIGASGPLVFEVLASWLYRMLSPLHGRMPAMADAAACLFWRGLSAAVSEAMEREHEAKRWWSKLWRI